MPEEEAQRAKVISTEPLSPQAKALLKAGENMLVDSLDTIKDFAKVMITLVSGLFATYFAILKFLGADNVTNPKVEAIVGIAITPPVLFILSILAFVASILPFYGKLSLNDPSSIKHARKISLYTKYVSVLAGTALFLFGMAFMGWVCIKLVLG